MSRKSVAILVAIIAAAGCKGIDAPTSGQVEAGATVASGLCSLIEGADDNGTVRTICATVEEVAAIVAFILTLRTSDAGTVAASTACQALPGSTLCATSAERAKAILFVSNVRASRFVLDGGAR